MQRGTETFPGVGNAFYLDCDDGDMTVSHFETYQVTRLWVNLLYLCYISINLGKQGRKKIFEFQLFHL